MTTNLPFSEWPQIIANPRLCKALVDRLTDRAHIITTGADSYCSARPHRLPWRATDEERAVVCALRRATNFALYDLTFVVRHFPPRLNRDSIWRILKAEGLNRRPKPISERPAKARAPSRGTTSASCT